MSVVQMTPCVFSPKWSEFVEWSARTFDMPVVCRFDDQGWGRLAATSPGVTVIDHQHFEEWIGDRQTVVELEVKSVNRAVSRAVELGAQLVAEPLDADGGRIAAIESPQEIVLFLWEEQPVEAPEPTVHQGPVHFTVARHIDAPVEEVFEAATKAEHQKRFWCLADASADFGDGDVVTWTWDEYGDFDLHILEFRPNEYVSFSWEADAGPYHTRAQFSFTPSDNGTRFAISESGWDADAGGLKDAFDHCEGWTEFLDHIRLYMERGLEWEEPPE